MLQVFSVIEFFLHIALNVASLILWFVVGMFLFHTKLLAVEAIWNIWFITWKGGEYANGIPVV